MIDHEREEDDDGLARAGRTATGSPLELGPPLLSLLRHHPSYQGLGACTCAASRGGADRGRRGLTGTSPAGVYRQLQ